VVYNKKWFQENKQHVNEYSVNRYKTDLQYKLSSVLRRRMSVAIRNGAKTGSAVFDLGCSIAEFKAKLEAKFYTRSTGEQMSWDNYGKRGWNLDHIIPLSSFDLDDREQFRVAAHYLNQQPLWREDNRFKSNVMPDNAKSLIEEIKAVLSSQVIIQIPPPQTERTCTASDGCGKTKPIEQFPLSGRKDHRRCICVECYKQRTKRDRTRNHDKILEGKRIYREKNRPKIRAKAKAYSKRKRAQKKAA
jgi:hypothetical protein